MASTNVVKMVIQFRRDTTENWLANKDVVPAAGEPCYDLDAKILKVGDGVTTYENLPEIGGAEISADGKSIIYDGGVLKLAGFDTAEAGAQPQKNADGEIEWVVPSDVSADIDALQAVLFPEGAPTLESRVSTLETQVETLNGDGEGSVKKTVEDEVTAQINDFASKISEDETVNTFKELVDYVAEHGSEVNAMVTDITRLEELIGGESVETQIDNALAQVKSVKYEISNKPEGTLVNYRDKEIRVMCPVDTKWALQTSGENSDPEKYYIGFKAYAPAGAVSFKEDTAEIIADNTMYYFENNDFAGVDQYGRKYSIIWLPAAQYDSDADTWSYYGEKSSIEKYIGWHYSVEWYDKNGKVIASDTIRINLSNENCHSAIEPFYMTDVLKGVSVNGTIVDAVNGVVDIAIAEQSIGVKGSEEVTVAEDGTLGIGTISFSKIVQSEGETVVLDGGDSNF